MQAKIYKTQLNEILPLRDLFLQENSFQIRYNACHDRGWTDSYLLLGDNEKIGYGAIKGNASIKDRDTLFEFYILPAARRYVFKAFESLLQASAAEFLESQSNERLLTSLLFVYGQNIRSDVILFDDQGKTDMKKQDVVFRKRTADDPVFEHSHEPVGDYVLAKNRQVVATGGFTLYYNPPFADLYMEVDEAHRRQGYGSFLIQELKKECYRLGRVPAARCHKENRASMKTLLKAGLGICGHMLLANVAPMKVPR